MGDPKELDRQVIICGGMVETKSHCMTALLYKHSGHINYGPYPKSPQTQTMV